MVTFVYRYKSRLTNRKRLKIFALKRKGISSWKALVRNITKQYATVFGPEIYSLFQAIKVNTIEFASLTFPCSTIRSKVNNENALHTEIVRCQYEN